jgi:hypothetical protein
MAPARARSERGSKVARARRMRFSFCGILALLVACSSSPPAADPPPAQADAGASSDEQPDAAEAEPDAGPSKLLGTCRTSADCQTGLICNTTFPKGLCTKDCATNAECGGSGVCADWPGRGKICLARCKTSSRRECGPAGMCFQLTERDFACHASCAADDPAASCVTASCNVHRGQCFSADSPARGGNGEPCKSNVDCKGYCYLEDIGDSMPQGHVGGMCMSFTPRPADDAFRAGQPLPRGRCPEGSVALPNPNWNLDPGDALHCHRACTSDSDCREGYMCRMEVLGTTYSVGGCDVIDCQLPGKTCPTGYSCKPFAYDPSVSRCSKDI